MRTPTPLTPAFWLSSWSRETSARVRMPASLAPAVLAGDKGGTPEAAVAEVAWLCCWLRPAAQTFTAPLPKGRRGTGATAVFVLDEIIGEGEDGPRRELPPPAGPRTSFDSVAGCWAIRRVEMAIREPARGVTAPAALLDVVAAVAGGACFREEDAAPGLTALEGLVSICSCCWAVLRVGSRPADSIGMGSSDLARWYLCGGDRPSGSSSRSSESTSRFERLARGV